MNAAIGGSPLPIYDQSFWHGLQETYRQIHTEPGYPEKNGTGFLVPYEIVHVPGKGRGVIASAAIPEGAKVWHSSYAAYFADEEEFMKFLSLLPIEAACDILRWAYVYQESCDDVGVDADDGSCEYYVYCDLDESALINAVDIQAKEVAKLDFCEYVDAKFSANCTGEEMRLKYGAVEEATFINAVQFINKGVELTMKYEDFHYEGYIPWFDKLWNISEGRNADSCTSSII